MSFKNVLKRLFSVLESNVIVGLDKFDSTEKRLRQASSNLCDEIRRLESARVVNESEIKKMGILAEENLADANKREDSLKASISRGTAVSPAIAKIILQRRGMAVALNKKIDELRQANISINNAILLLADQLDDIKANLELVKVQKESHSLGLASPEDIELSANLTKVDVDAIIREIGVTDPRALSSGPSELDVEEYIRSLSQPQA